MTNPTPWAQLINELEHWGNNERRQFVQYLYNQQIPQDAARGASRVSAAVSRLLEQLLPPALKNVPHYLGVAQNNATPPALPPGTVPPASLPGTLSPQDLQSILPLLRNQG
jgi:hypothetical protein